MGIGDCHLDKVPERHSICCCHGVGSKLLRGTHEEDDSYCPLPYRVRPRKHFVTTALPTTVQGELNMA